MEADGWKNVDTFTHTGHQNKRNKNKPVPLSSAPSVPSPASDALAHHSRSTLIRFLPGLKQQPAVSHPCE